MGGTLTQLWPLADYLTNVLSRLIRKKKKLLRSTSLKRTLNFRIRIKKEREPLTRSLISHF